MAKVKLSYNLDIEPESHWHTATPSTMARSAFLYVQEVGDFNARSAYETTREGLPSFLIKYVLSGSGYLRYRDQTYALTPGRFFWIDCMQPQQYGTAPGSAHWHVLWVHYNGANSRRYYEQFLSLNNGSNVAEAAHSSAMQESMRALLTLAAARQSSAQAEVRASALLTGIMADCIEASGASSQTLPAMPESVKTVRKYLTEHYTERITLEDLSRAISMDKYYFQKLFKRHIGMTPNEFLIVTRLMRAKELLRTTDSALAEIAGEVGISNVSHFITLFKRREGVTPNIYRQSWYNK